MIKRLKLRNFKIFDEFEQEFGPVNVLIGPNGSGKSTLLQAIHILRGFSQPDLERFIGDDAITSTNYRELVNLYDENDLIEWDVSVDVFDFVAYEDNTAPGERYIYNYKVELQIKSTKFNIESERLSYLNNDNEEVLLFERNGRKIKILNEDSGNYKNSEVLNLSSSVIANIEVYNPDDIKSYRKIVNFKYWLSGIRQPFEFDSKALREPGSIKSPYLDSNGGNLPSAIIGAMASSKQNRFVEYIKGFYPSIKKIDASQAIDYMTYLSVLEDAGEKKQIRPPQMADGLLRLLAVTSLAFEQRFPFSIQMFEEIENGVHPRLLSKLVETLKLLTQREVPYSSQIFLTTHSPYLLDEFNNELDSVYVFDRKKGDNQVKVKRLSEMSGVDLAKELYSDSLGEIWYNNLFGG